MSTREVELLAQLATGATNKQLAKSLFISEATVKTHLVHIYQKLGVTNRTAAINMAREQRLDLADEADTDSSALRTLSVICIGACVALENITTTASTVTATLPFWLSSCCITKDELPIFDTQIRTTQIARVTCQYRCEKICIGRPEYRFKRLIGSRCALQLLHRADTSLFSERHDSRIIYVAHQILVLTSAIRC